MCIYGALTEQEQATWFCHCHVKRQTCNKRDVWQNKRLLCSFPSGFPSNYVDCSFYIFHRVIKCVGRSISLYIPIIYVIFKSYIKNQSKIKPNELFKIFSTKTQQSKVAPTLLNNGSRFLLKYCKEDNSQKKRSVKGSDMPTTVA